MRYSNFPDHINVEETSEQGFQPLLPPKKSKGCEEGDRNWSTKLDSRQVYGGIE